MGDHVLAGIIDLEKALQDEVLQEEARAAAWQRRELAALEAGSGQARRDVEQWLDARGEAARNDAVAEGEALRRAGARRCELLAALPEAVLSGLLRRELGRLLPEDGHDHPDGEG